MKLPFLKKILPALLLLFVSCTSSQVFQITFNRPVSELLKEALKAKPPVEKGEFRKTELVELVKLDPSFKLDILYATENNFLSAPVYSQARAFLQHPAAEALVKVNKALNEKGYCLLIHDAYRPWYVTKVFWDVTPDSQKRFVADPAKGSMHNRGCAVDLTLFDLRKNEMVTMPSIYDEMSERAYPGYTGGTEEERRLRDLLRSAMEAEGFKVYEYEWWHFNYKDWPLYTIQNIRFEEIK